MRALGCKRVRALIRPSGTFSHRWRGGRREFAGISLLPLRNNGRREITWVHPESFAAKEDPRIKSGGDEKGNGRHTLIMPWLDHGILFLAAEEDPRIKSGGDERGKTP